MPPARTAESTRTVTPAVNPELAPAGSRSISAWAPYLELTKPRLSLLSIITAVVGYLAARPGPGWLALGSLVVGTSLAAAGAAALNMWMEREADARMKRTQGRPLPAGQVEPWQAVLFGGILSLAGVSILAAGAGLLPALLGAATILSYLFLYTPLKQRTPLCTHVGALPGALPPLIGWSAAEGSIDPLGWILFALLLAWQMPHFMAIAWLYREDYARGGMRMSTVEDPTGHRAAWQAATFSVLLLGLSLAPAAIGAAGWPFAVVALPASFWMLAESVRFTRPEQRTPAARRLFRASIIYLPLVLAALVADRMLGG